MSLLWKNPTGGDFLRKFAYFGAALAGALAGFVKGIFGGAGGMVLIPALRLWTDVEDDALFSMSVSVMVPVCLLSLGFAAAGAPLPWGDATPYLLGSALGGVLVGFFGRKIPAKWLHRIFGLLLLWGGVRYLW